MDEDRLVLSTVHLARGPGREAVYALDLFEGGFFSRLAADGPI